MPFRKLGLYCGVIGPVLWLALIATAGALRPDFSHITHYISELGERGSTTESLMRYWAFGFTGLLYVCFAGALLATVRDGWLPKAAALLIALEGVGRMGAGVFPCDPGCGPASLSQDLHRVFATVGFGSGILSAILWGFHFRRLPRFRPLSSFSVGTGVIALVSLLFMSWADNPVQTPGLFELLATGILSVWLLVFASRLTWGAGTSPGVPDHSSPAQDREPR